MVNVELLEFHYFDDILTDMKLTPVRTFVVNTLENKDTCVILLHTLNYGA